MLGEDSPTDTIQTIVVGQERGMSKERKMEEGETVGERDNTQKVD